MHLHHHISESYVQHDDVARWERLEYTDEPNRRSERRQQRTFRTEARPPRAVPSVAALADWVRSVVAASAR
jgi:hypothetical protein